jgi:hypothetical protein
MKPWLVVAGDFTPLGGMDVANLALARHLARRGDEVHVVAHQPAQPRRTGSRERGQLRGG